MSRQPGPYARPFSTRHGVFCMVPLGKTVSIWPPNKTGFPGRSPPISPYRKLPFFSIETTVVFAPSFFSCSSISAHMASQPSLSGLPLSCLTSRSRSPIISSCFPSRNDSAFSSCFLFSSFMDALPLAFFLYFLFLFSFVFSFHVLFLRFLSMLSSPPDDSGSPPRPFYRRTG